MDNDDIYGVNRESERYDELIATVDALREELKGRKGESDSKGNKRKIKKLKKQLKIAQQKPSWWHKALVKSLPKLMDFASVVIRNRK